MSPSDLFRMVAFAAPQWLVAMAVAIAGFATSVEAAPPSVPAAPVFVHLGPGVPGILYEPPVVGQRRLSPYW